MIPNLIWLAHIFWDGLANNPPSRFDVQFRKFSTSKNDGKNCAEVLNKIWQSEVYPMLETETASSQNDF